MIRGMYASASGMLTGIARQDLLANNLANVDTVGYLGTRSATQAFVLALSTASQAGNLLRGGGGPVAATLDTAEGPVKPTGNKFDLAIIGGTDAGSCAMFAVQTPQGLQFTRDGRFQLNGAGRLVDARGNPVVGVNGFIDLSPTGDFSVSETGEVKSGGKSVGQLLIAQLPSKSLQAAGAGLYTSSGQPKLSTTARIVQGSLEESNVSAVAEMAAMLDNSRYYDANAAALKEQDQSVQELVSQVMESS